MADALTTTTAPSTPPPIPDALRPHVPIGQPDAPFNLYTGLIEFTQNGKTFCADGCVRLVWYPSPTVQFEVPRLPNGVRPTLGALSFRLEDGTTVKGAMATGLNLKVGKTGSFASMSGFVVEQVIRPADGAVRHVMFLLPNFQPLLGRPTRYPDGSCHANRLTLRGDGWVITLDAVDDQEGIKMFLDSHSGFAISHVGRLEKEDGKPFAASDAWVVLEALAFYVSFSGGQWTGPCLPTGFNAAGEQVWQVWRSSRTVPFLERLSWLDSRHGQQFEDPFPGFMKLILDKNWEEIIQIAILWYVEANDLRGWVESSIVKTQTAFELLSSAVLVEQFRWLSTDGYEKIPAADRIRLLFLWAGIPTEIPAALAELTKQAKADNWPDTATAMTMIRNTITHPTKKNREKLGKHLKFSRTEAWILGMWNLELCLLRLFEYKGSYYNRITQKAAGTVEMVPWAPEAVS